VRPFALLTVVCLTALAGALASTPASAVSACGKAGYSYAGFQAVAPAHGVRADLIALGSPQVESGHVAAWVGVGGPGQGSGGRDAWIQTGFASFGGSQVRLYFEVTRPGAGTRYTEVKSQIAPGSRHRIAVLEVFRRPGWWKVWADGKPVSEPVYLAGSHGRWRPIATAETWDGGRRVCNLFSYRFGRVSVAGAGGAWRKFRTGYRFQDPGYRVIRSGNGFLARGVRALARPVTTMEPQHQAVEPAATTPEAATDVSAATSEAVDSPSG
jgi:hypothetical protein